MPPDPASCRRGDARAVIARPSTVRAPDETPRDVTVEDLSSAGFSFSSAAAIPAGTILHVGLAGAGRASARVAWSRGDRHGCVFQPALTSAQVDAAFSHAIGNPAASFAPAGTAIPADVARPATPGLPPVVRFALTSLAGGLCWAALAAGLNGLS